MDCLHPLTLIVQNINTVYLYKALSLFRGESPTERLFKYRKRYVPQIRFEMGAVANWKDYESSGEGFEER